MKTEGYPSLRVGRAPRASVLLALTALSACAAGKTPDVAPAPVTGRALGSAGGRRGFGLEVTKRADGVEATYTASVSAVFTALEAAFTATEIPLTLRDPARGSIGNEGYKFRRKLADLPSRRLFDCGGTSGMPNAETYTITMSVLSNVSDAGGGTVKLVTVVQASAENPNYPGSGVACASTGVLEDRLAAAVRNRLALSR